ncbi:LLM class flavin-dependent oxidoreductase [Embleya sp. NBC_00888]|uniref:LLM class flavin-dependent oxidoreductase n=1 Tax=Embleya sp. NBC_00888 TaxID=2975960 RepID=UPI00386DCAFA|nr:LLM class flavin-dependent oxidoreductase [Embleya sp. NBC_00888]
MTLHLRGGVRAAPVPGTTPHERAALRFVADPPARDADPEHVVRTAREAEEAGLDSVLVTQSATWPDPWLVAGWALAATRRLHVTVAHRVGTTAPTAAARALATLDRLSAGRAGVHVIIGSSDADLRRDGDFLPKAERYRRADEYLAVFTRTLSAREPFDFDGEFYRVREAWSGLRAVRRPRPELSFGGSSHDGVALAGRYADVYGLAIRPYQETATLVARARAEAASHGRELRFWRHGTYVLAASEQQARARAEDIVARARAHAEREGPEAFAGSVQVLRDREATGGVADPDDVAVRVRANLDAAFVGTPESAAAAALRFHHLGIDILQVSTPLESEEDRALHRELIARLRAGAAAG